MRLRKAIVIAAVPALLLTLGAGAWNWLLHSESGARWLFGKLQSSPSFSLDAASVSGDIGAGLQLTGFVFENGTVRVDIAEIEAAVNVDLLPPSVHLDFLRSGAIDIQAKQNTEPADEQPANLEETIQALTLPIPVHVHDVRVSRLEYLDQAQKPVIELESLQLRGSIHKALVVEQFAVSAEQHALAIQGQMEFTPPHPLELKFNTVGEFTLGGQVSGTLDQLQLDIEHETPSARLNGRLLDILAAPRWNLELTSPELRWPLDEPDPQAAIKGLRLTSKGQWSGYTLNLAGTLEAAGLEPGALEIAGSGDPDSFSASRISLDGPQFALETEAEISWRQELEVTLQAALERLDPVTWIEGWPENHFLEAQLAAEWRGDEVVVPGFNLAVSGTPFVASGNARVEPSGSVVDGQFEWQSLEWPPGAEFPQFSSKQGRFEVTGSPEDWQTNGALDVQVGEYPESAVALSGSGDLESLEIQIYEAAILEGVLAGALSFNWTGNQPFETSLTLTEINTGALLEEYPGVINTELTASGQLQPLAAEVEIQQFDGSLGQIPISASGRIGYREGAIQADSLAVRSGSSSLTVDGNPYQAGGLEFAAEITSLADFHPQFAGQLSTRGNISLDPNAPSITGILDAHQLVLGDIVIDSIETRQNELLFTGLTLGERPLDSLMLAFNSGRPLETLAIHAVVENRSINMEFAGSVTDWADPAGSGWKGHLAGFDLSRDQFVISLDQPAPLEFSSTRLGLSDACLTGSRDAKLCMAASWQSPDQIEFSTDLNAIPLSVLELFIESDVRFSQVLSGTLNWAQASSRDRSGRARMELSPGDITLEGEDDLRVETGPGLFAFEVSNGRLQQGILDFSFPQAGTIDVDFSAADLREGTDSAIQGNARVDLRDLGFMARLFPVFNTSGGVVDVDLALGGTLSDPTFNGTASVTNGRVENQASGFSFSEINLAGEISESDEAVLKGSFRAGEGTGELDAWISFQDMLSPEIRFELTGEDLTVIDVPDLEVIANPDLQLTWGDKTLGINGRLYIPSTRLAPSYLPKASAGQSEDVVIVAGELPPAQQDFLQENAIKLRGELEVELGDNVVVDLDIAKIDVTGAARFNWQDQLVPMANGSFNATGDIQAFGQFLRVTQGRVSFPDSPADNPHLNIRAEREIFGNSQIRRAGLMVAGTLKRPVVEPYTVPMTNKDRARTLLVTGSDFNYEQGVGAVDVGMYVMPRLYVSYGIGVFEDGNVLKVRYDLGRGFGVRATSGQRESGLDISYTIDR